MQFTDTYKTAVINPDIHSIDGKVSTAEPAKNVDWFPLLMVVAIGFFYLFTIRTGHEWGDDFSLYIMHARNIASGFDYRQGAYLHYSPYLGPDAYPPIFPLLLAPVCFLFGINLTAMKAVLIVTFLASLLAFRLVVKRDISPGWQVALVTIIGLNPYLWDQKDRLTSDLAFLIFAYLGMVLVNQAYQAKISDVRKWSLILATGIVFYLAYGTRSLGILLIPSLLIFDVIRNKKLVPSKFALGGTVITLCLVAMQSYFLHSDKGYYDQFATSFHDSMTTWVKYIVGNLKSYAFSLTDIWDNGFNRLFRLGLTVTITGFAIWGYLGRLRKNIAYADIFVAIYITVVLIVPMDGGLRYLIPIIPFYIFYAQQGVTTLQVGKDLRNAAIALMGIAILIAYTTKYSKQDFKHLPDGIEKAESVEFFNYVKHQTLASDVFIFTKPRALALFTDRKSSFYPMDLDDKGLWDYFQKIQATHIVLGPKGISLEEQAFLTEFIGKYSTSLREEFSNKDFNLYRIIGIPQASGRTNYTRMRLTDPLPKGAPSSQR